jgi:EmrB/QacA subfamily drug resistance transporter
MTHRTPLHEQPDIHQRRWFLLGVMCLSLVMVVMAVSGINVALPSMQQSLDADATDLQWIVDSYAIVFAGLLLTAGAIGDRFGRKLALMGGLAVFASGSLLGALADTSNVVILSRAIAGIGAAFIMPATLSLISAIFPPVERSKAIAIWAGFAGAGGALGPLVVGFLLTGWWVFPSFWWGSAFVVNVVASLAVLVAVALYAPRSRDDDQTPLDPLGAGVSLVGVAALLYGIIEGPARGWADGLVVGAFVVAVVMGVLFIVWELRTEHPMLPMQYFRNRKFSTGSGVITFGFMVMFGFFFLITQYFQFVRGWSPLRAGVATLPFALTMIAVSPRSAGFVERFGINKVIGAGFSLIAVGFVVLAALTPSTSYLVIVVALVLLSAGMATTIAPATGAIMSSVPLNKAGVGSAVNDTTRELGGALGIAVLGSVVASGYRSEFDAGGLPGDAGTVAGESIGGAIRVARSIGGPDGESLIRTAGAAFTDAINTAFVASAVIAVVVGALVVLAGRRSAGGSEVVETVAVET